MAVWKMNETFPFVLQFNFLPFYSEHSSPKKKKITKSVISQVMRFINTSENYREKLKFQYDYNYFHNFFLPICKKQVCLSLVYLGVTKTSNFVTE